MAHFKSIVIDDTKFIQIVVYKESYNLVVILEKVLNYLIQKVKKMI